VRKREDNKSERNNNKSERDRNSTSKEDLREDRIFFAHYFPLAPITVSLAPTIVLFVLVTVSLAHDSRVRLSFRAVYHDCQV